MTATQEDARLILEAGSQLLAGAVAAAKEMTGGGKTIDDHQVITERVAYAATEAVAAHEVLAELDAWAADGNLTPIREKTAIAAVGELMSNLRDRLSAAADDTRGRNSMDLGAMVNHLSAKHEWVQPLRDEDHVARLLVLEMPEKPERLDDVVAEIAMGRSILEG